MSEKLPEGWKEHPLLSILETIVDYRGISVPKAESGIPLITARNIRDGFYDFSEQEYIDSHAYLDWTSRGLPQNNDILFTTEAPLGKACLFPQDGQYAIGQRVISLRPKNKLICSRYLLYFLLSEEGQSRINFRATGTTAKGIKSSEVKQVNICYPAFSEQQKIARILTTWDVAITCTQKLLENSKQQKKALMQQLLTGRRRSVNSGTAWGCSTIRELSTRVTRQSDGKAHPILTISSVSGFVRQDTKYRRYMAGESVNRYILLQEGEFAYNKGNSKTYEFGCIFPLSNFKTGLVPHVYVCFKIHGKYCAEFYKYLFESDYLKKQLGDIVNTGVRNNGLLNIKPEEFLSTTVPVPPLDEQKAIAKILTTADALIAQYEARLAHLQQQKKALMQQLLTGKIRVTADTPGTSDDACETPA